MTSEPIPASGNPVPPGPNPKPKPEKIFTIGILMLINGIINVLVGLGWAGGLALSVVGCFCMPVGALPMVLGILEIVYGIKATSSVSAPPSFGTLQTIAVLEIVCIVLGNFISLILGIINLVFLSEADVKAYYGQA